MDQVFAIVTFLFVVAHQAIASPELFCQRQNKNCPNYTLVHNHGQYQERRYLPGIWVETKKMRAGESNLLMIQRLFDFMKKENSLGINLPMSMPVVGHLTAGAVPGDTQSMRIYLGPDPSPRNFVIPGPKSTTNPTVHIHHDPAMNYYVLPFTTADWRNLEVWNEKAKVLKRLANVNHNEYLAAGYGPVGRSGLKYNEIWMSTSNRHSDHHYHHHAHNDPHDHHHDDHEHVHDDVHGHDHGGDDHNH